MPRKWTLEQKRAQAAAMKAYWQANPHPRDGMVARRETLDLQRESQRAARIEQRGFCKRCGGPLYTDESVALGYGRQCLKLHIEEGYITYDPYSRTITELSYDATED